MADDSSKCPDEGFEWRGEGEPEDGLGNWIRGDKKNREKLYPDFNHKYHPPHWDYYSPEFPGGVRIYPEKWEYK